MKILCLDILYIFLLKRYRASKNWWTLTLRYVIGNLSKRSCNDPQVGNSAILNQTLVDRTRGSVCKIQVEKIENNPPTLWSSTPLRELLFMKRIVVNCIYIYIYGSRWRLVRGKGCCNSKKKGARTASTNKGVVGWVCGNREENKKRRGKKEMGRRKQRRK